MPRTKITIYGGIHEIGGTKFLVEDRGTKIFLDFGMQMAKVIQYFAEFLQPRVCNGMEETARRFFGKDTINFMGIDGTEYSKPLFDMIIFYPGAYSCEGTINFSEEKENLEVKYQNRFMDQGKDISSCVPVYVDKVPDIDQTFLNRSQGQVNPMKALTEEVIIDNTNVANFLMTFSEFYLAYKFAASSKKCDLIFLDRSLSNTYSSLGPVVMTLGLKTPVSFFIL